MPPKGEEKTHPNVHPLGLIYLGDISHLLATLGFEEKILAFSMHRIVNVDVIHDMKANIPTTFDIDTYIAQGNLGIPRNKGKKISLEARFRGPRSKRFEETPLSEDQSSPIRDPDGWVRIRATLNDTEQLRWWLLGYGKDVEVINPSDLREALAGVSRAMAGIYQPY